CRFFFQAEDGIRDFHVTGVQTCALPIYPEIDTMAKRFDPDVYERRVRPVLHKWFEDKTKAELEEIVGDAVPLSAIKNIREVVEDPQIAARDMIVDVERSEERRVGKEWTCRSAARR